MKTGYFFKNYFLLFMLSCINLMCFHEKPAKEVEVISHQTAQNSNHALQILSLKKKAKNGDLVTRTGNDFTSQSLKTLNRRNKTFSHCGIVHIENDTVFVYHALGGEWNPNQKLRKDPFEEFADPVSNNLIGLFRYNLPRKELHKMVEVADSLYQIAIPFDMDFSLDTKDKMYCAEFVLYCLQEASPLLSDLPLSQINDFIFVGVDDLFLQKICEPVGVIKYR